MILGKAVSVFAACLLACATARAQRPVGVEALNRLDLLPQMRSDVWAYQCSSHDRNGRNYDWTGILGTVGNEKILMDVQGPGCVYRVWFTADVMPLGGRIRVYFDGASTPTIDLPMETMFDGTHPWFPAPLVGNPSVSAGGYYAYVPLAFRAGCRVTTTNTAGLLYYNINFHRYVTDEGVSTFDGSQDLAATVAMWNQVGSDPKPDHGTHVAAGTLGLAAGQTVEMASIDGAGTIQSIELTLPSPLTSVLSDASLQLTWDDEASPAVDCPLGTFFGSGLGPATVAGLPLGMSGNRLYCFFPMPYRRRASLVLSNGSAVAVNGVGYSIRYTPGAPPADACKFYARHHRQQPVTFGHDYSFLSSADDAGHVVGVVQNLRGRQSGQWYLEGDERFYVDGGLSAALNGTGTEDFYNGGWYFQDGVEFTRPLHGHPRFINGSLKSDGCYRFMLGELIPFRNTLRAGIEHGGWNDDPVDMESVMFYYRAGRAVGFQTDFLNVADAVSEAAHAYTWSNQVWTGSTAAGYESNGDGVVITDAGRWLGAGGSSRFKVSTYPCGAYVMLRRCLNYGVPRQQADVYVDDVYAGRWYDAGSNAADGSRQVDGTAFRDSEFFVPPALARNKRSLDVRIVNVSPESEWTEYFYHVQTVRSLQTHPLDFDADDDVDQEDFGLVQACLSGDQLPQWDVKCKMARLDADTDVDVVDVRMFLECLSGPNSPADPGCLN